MGDIMTSSNLSLASLHHQHKPNVNGNLSAIKTGATAKHKSRKQICCQKLKDGNWRRKVFHTICIYSSFLAMASAKGLLGPTFLDLQAVSGVGLEQGTWLLTCMYIGYMSGAILGGGILYNRMNRELLFTSAVVLVGVALFAIPWCSIYYVMLTAFFVMGIAIGVIDSVANAEIIGVWGQQGRPFMQALHLMFSFGVSIAPLYTVPFLSEKQIPPITQDRDNPFLFSNASINEHHINEDTFNKSYFMNSTSFFGAYGGKFSNNTQNMTSGLEMKFNLYIPYFISGGVGLVSGLMFIVFFCLNQTPKTTTNNKIVDDSDTKRNLHLPYKIISCILLSGIIALTCAIDDNLMSFLTTFCVKQLHWSKAEGSFLTSLVGFAVVLGRFIGVFIVNFINPLKILSVHCFMILLVFVALTIAATYQINIAIWIIMPIFGYAKAPIFGSLFTWTDEVFFPVTGKISSMFFIVITATMGVNPLILGYLMQNVSHMWFCYLFLIESIILVVVFVLAAILSKVILKKFGKTYRDNIKTVDNSLLGESE